MRPRLRQLVNPMLAIPRRYMPFSDAASPELPLPRLLRLSLFQVSVGMAIVLLTGTLNRVMIVELGVPAWIVALMVALPVLFAPFRALVGFRSDTHKSALGWRRIPYLWYGTLLQWGGLAFMPMALILMSGDTTGPYWVGPAAAALAFFMVGAGLHTTQTAGLALATDIAPEETRPRVVALLYVMLLVGMAGSAILFGWLLADFSKVRLIQIVQGAAVATLVINLFALWKQEVLKPHLTRHDIPRPSFREAWGDLMAGGRAGRLLVAIGLGTAGFSMQDVLLEPYGGEVLGLSVSDTTLLTAILASGSLAGFALAGRRLIRGADPCRLAAWGAVVGVFAFAAVILAAPLGSGVLFRVGTALIGFGGGLFAVGTLTAAMDLARAGGSGLALGAWGSVQATAMGLAVASGGALRDVVGGLAQSGALGPALGDASAGYGFVYHVEIALLFATLIAIGPLVRRAGTGRARKSSEFGLAEFPA
ncbi:PucC family protein [Limibaculum sp. FT325]|uniref:PucC family protein n=1 Tax=Thermohalobaculum sediminis TaxID=2939436 RepID=UPI0020C10EAF|nr:PucC family protein [Limibaculum sediminis]MCL5778606.1 PucC family protein [Limibaculum sediminis]